MLNKELTVFFVLGFFLVGYLNLNITAIAIFAVIIAVVLSGLKFRAVSGAGAAGDSLDDYDPLEDDL